MKRFPSTTLYNIVIIEHLQKKKKSACRLKNIYRMIQRHDIYHSFSYAFSNSTFPVFASVKNITTSTFHLHIFIKKIMFFINNDMMTCHAIIPLFDYSPVTKKLLVFVLTQHNAYSFAIESYINLPALKQSSLSVNFAEGSQITFKNVDSF